MMSNNKILTVSYGTFSCTLEGFDDAFGTMKAIAEYFRDLAADDRYFGAEPPQPDAEMLARIAEREISRRVEARAQDGHVVLSASDEDQKPERPAVAAPTPAPTVAAAATAAAGMAAAEPAPESAPLDLGAIGERVEDSAEDEFEAEEGDVVEAEPVEAEDLPSPEPESIAAKLARIRAVVAKKSDARDNTGPITLDATMQVDAEPETPDDSAADEADAAEDAHEPSIMWDEPVVAETPAEAPEVAESAEAIAAEVEVEAEAEAEAEDYADEPVAEEEETDVEVEDAPVEMTAEDEAVAETEAELPEEAAAIAEAPEESVAADEDDAIEPAAEEMPEDETAEDEDDLSVLDAVSAAAEDDVLAEDAAPADDAADDSAEEDTLSAIMAQFEDEDDSQYEDEAEALETAPMILSSDYAANLLSTDNTDTDTEAEAKSEDNLFGDDDDLVADASDGTEDRGPFEDSVAAAMLSDFEDEDTADTVAEDETDAPSLRARVIKVERATLEAAIEDGTLEDISDIEEPAVEDDEDYEPDLVASSTLSPEAEAELMEDLAAVEADLDDDLTDDIDAPVAEDDVEDDQIAAFEDAEAEEAETVLARDQIGETDVERLMAEAEQQLDEPEGSSRRNAFAHLRAAVAARKVDDKLADADPAEEEDAYRSDLASVVRPRRPTASGSARSTRPSDARPAPLKLVAEQRVDVPSSVEARGPVRPRRVAGMAERASEDGSNFAEYATQMGAHSLPDLLEAAASYLSFVEGREQFSRPQLMTKVRQVEKDDFSREDSMRSFGQLLRAGKIEKIKGGRFTVTGDIGYRPDERAAG